MKMCLAIVCAALVASSATAADPVVEGILADWKARQTKFKTAKYVVTGYSERLDKPPSPRQPYSLTVLIDIEKKRLRIEKATRDPSYEGGYVDRKTIHSFDGKTFYSFTPREINRIPKTRYNLYTAKGNLTTLPYEGDIYPILEAHGIVPLANRIPRPDRLPIDHDPETIALQGEVTHSERKCAILKGEPLNNSATIFDELYTDRERAGAVMRHTYYSRKNPWFRVDVSFAEQGGAWMPTAWVCIQYQGDSTKIQAKITLKVDSLEFDLPVSDSDFVRTPEPGDIVRADEFPEPGAGLDPRKPATKILEPNSSGTLELKSETGFTTGEGKQLPPEQHTGWLWWLVLVPLVLAVVGILLWRRARTPKTP